MIESFGIATATVHSVLAIVDIFGNCLVCAIIKKHRDMRYVEAKITRISHSQFETLLKAYTTTLYDNEIENG